MSKTKHKPSYRKPKARLTLPSNKVVPSKKLYSRQQSERVVSIDAAKYRQDKYWICSDCARAQGLKPPKGPVTCINGLCAHCDGTDIVSLTPVCDFNTSDGYGLD